MMDPETPLLAKDRTDEVEARDEAFHRDLVRQACFVYWDWFVLTVIVCACIAGMLIFLHWVHSGQDRIVEWRTFTSLHCDTYEGVMFTQTGSCRWHIDKNLPPGTRIITSPLECSSPQRCTAPNILYLATNTSFLLEYDSPLLHFSASAPGGLGEMYETVARCEERLSWSAVWFMCTT